MTKANRADYSGLTATEIVRGISAGHFTAEAVMRSCLDRISELEGAVNAWAHIDYDAALAAARRCDEQSRRGALRGVPFGAKDIIDSYDMPTEWGSSIHKGAQASRDAACIALPRKAGAILVGKTVTSEFANVTPGKSRNPRDTSRTPGGSSNGTAAAVGASMVPVAIGTQTTGSTIRPSSFCGIVGYRPTYGEHRLHGVMEASGSLDTIGLCARSVEDVALFRGVMLGIEPAPVPVLPAPRIGFCRTYMSNLIYPETQRLVEEAAKTLERAGATLTDVELPVEFGHLTEAHRWISSFEFARNFTWELEHHRDRISEPLRGARIADGLNCPFERYLEAIELAESCRLRMDGLWNDYDILLTASAIGEAPVGWDHLLGADIYKMWTVLHVPTLSLPVLTGPNGMPIGLQLLARRHRDRDLFAHGAWAFNLLK